MLVIPRYKILFVHIHKNAGTSVKRFLFKACIKASPGWAKWFAALNDLLPFTEEKQVYVRKWNNISVKGHERLSVILKKFPELEAYSNKFTVVRNPWDRLVSAFYWIKGKNPGSAGLNRDNLQHITDFDSFVRGLYTSYRSDRVTHSHANIFHKPESKVYFSSQKMVYPSQTSYILDQRGKLLTNFYIRQENLAQELGQHFSSILNLDNSKLPKLSRHGASTRPTDYASLYTEETKQMVAEIYEPDINLLDYSFHKNS